MNKIKETNPELFNKIKANVENVTKAKISNMAPSNEKMAAAEQNMMFQKMMQEKQQMERVLESQKNEMDRMVNNQQRIIEQQNMDNSILKNKINIAPMNNTVPSKIGEKSNINSILNKLKLNLPKNDDTSSVTEENTSDKRVLMTSTVDSEKRGNIKSSIQNKKSILNIKR
jgi:hypothetical protein